jgi:hypothetical protein
MAGKDGKTGGAGPTRNGGVFREVSSGRFTATVMDRSSYSHASGKANKAIEQAVKNSPKR